MCLTITWIKLCRLSVGKYFLERAAGIEPASSVWKTEVLTITQRPLTNYLLFHTLGGVKTAMTDAARKSDDMGGKRPIADLGATRRERQLRAQFDRSCTLRECLVLVHG